MGSVSIFYQMCWSTVRADVVAYVQNFFTQGGLCKGNNENSIVLIPKKENPTDMSEFRPISLCNVLYKIASKVLANRMKLVLNTVISESQSAFVLVGLSLIKSLSHSRFYTI